MRIEFLPILLFIFLIQGCKNMYVPNMQNVPMQKGKNNLKLMLNPNNYQASYTITDNIGIIGNASYRKNSWFINSNDNKTSFINTTYLFEGGIGYYKTVDTSKIMEIYAGGGYGNVKHNLKEEKGSGNGFTQKKLSANTGKIFIQPTIGYSGKNVEFGFTPRFTGIQFSNRKIKNYSNKNLVNYELNKVKSSSFFVFFEPGLTFRMGWPPIKAHMQIIYSNKINSEPLNYKKLNLNLGLHVNIFNTIEYLKKQ